VLIAFAWRRAHRIIAGGLPFALILAIYNKIAFGTFFALSSGNERNAEFRELAGHGIFGIGVPKLTTLMHLLLDPSKGLLIFSPVLLIALAAIPRARTTLTKPAFGALVATPLALLIISCPRCRSSRCSSCSWKYAGASSCCSAFPSRQ
jgi:hypothetical protein